MVEASVKTEDVLRFCRHLEEEERSPGTIEKYFRDVRAFARWADGAPLTKELTARWKERLLTRGYAPGTINAMLAPLSGAGGLQAEVPADPAAAVSRCVPGADEGGI